MRYGDLAEISIRWPFDTKLASMTQFRGSSSMRKIQEERAKLYLLTLLSGSIGRVIFIGSTSEFSDRSISQC